MTTIKNSFPCIKKKTRYGCANKIILMIMRLMKIAQIASNKLWGVLPNLTAIIWPTYALSINNKRPRVKKIKKIEKIKMSTWNRHCFSFKNMQKEDHNKRRTKLLISLTSSNLLNHPLLSNCNPKNPNTAIFQKRIKMLKEKWPKNIWGYWQSQLKEIEARD